MAITFALVVIVYEWLTTKHETPNKLTRLCRSALSATPYLLITLCYLIVRKLVLHRATKVDPNHTNFDVVLTCPLVLLTYLRLLIFPKGLTGLYHSPYAIPPGFWNFVFPLFVLCAFAVIICYWAKHKDDPIVALSALWMIIGLIPVLYLRALPSGGAVRDRYLYLPSVGFVLLLAKAIRMVRLKNNEVQSIKLRWALVTVICAACIAGVLVQQVYWANNLLLFYRGYVLCPQNIDGAMELASALMKRSEYSRALPILTALTHDHPQVGPPHYYLAQAYIHLGRKTEAQNALNTALELTPEVVQSNSGKSEVATLFAQLGDFESALKLYLDVLREEPDLYSANYNCGYMYFLRRQDAAAEKLLLHAVQVGPGFAPPIFYLGRIYLRAGKATVAESYFRRALAIDANGYDFHYWLGQALAANDRLNEARTEYAEELRLHPQNTNAVAALSMAAEHTNISSR
jgi:protein O-mannosyl-transferase